MNSLHPPEASTSPSIDAPRRIRAALAASTLAVALGACAVVDARDDDRQYRRVLDGVVAPVADPKLEEALTVERAMAMSSRHDEGIGLRGEDYVQALFDRRRAVAAFLPKVSLQPSFIIGDRPSGFHPGTAGLGEPLVERGDTLQGLDVPVVASVNLFRGMGDVAALRAAEAVIAQRGELLLDLQSTVMFNAAQTCYQVLRSERAIEVLRDSVRLQEARLADVEQQLKNGLAIALTVSQTRAQLDATRVSLLRAETDVRDGRAALALVIGVPAAPNPIVDSIVVPEQVASETEFERVAVESRRDLTAARDAILAAQRGVDAAVAEYYPSVNLNFDQFLSRSMFADASKWNALLSANLPIFSAGLIEADVRAAWSRLRQAALQESSVRRQVARDVQVAYEDLASSRRRIVQLEDEVRAADDARSQAQNGFKNGLAVNLDVLNAENQLLAANLDLASARFDRTVFYLDLVRATGRLVPGLAPDGGPPKPAPAGAGPPR